MKYLKNNRPAARFRQFTLVMVLALSSMAVWAGGKADPLLGSVIVDQLEIRDADHDNPAILEAQAWAGYDLDKLWFKIEAERVDGETEELELQALYSKAISRYWNLQGGLRHDFEPEPGRSWAVIGLQGLAPYFFEVDTALFIGESGQTNLRFEAEYEMLFTQKLILSPEIEVNFHGRNDPDTGVGSGLSDLELGLRLRYEIRREIAPYVGINWQRKFGNTADFAGDAGEDIEDTQLVAGIRMWF